MQEQRVGKLWGYEVWFSNNNKYCGKLLCVNEGKWSSNGRFHYHKIKDETFFVIEGSLLLDYEEDGVFYSITLRASQSFRVLPGVKHRFSSEKGQCKFIEASTTHMESDSYRCEWDMEKEEWIEAIIEPSTG